MNIYDNENFNLDGAPTLVQKQRTVEITQELFTELLIKADRYDILLEQARDKNYLTDLEKALFSIESDEADNIDAGGVGP